MPERKSAPLRGLAAAPSEVRRRVSQIGGFVAYINADDEHLQTRAEKGGAETLRRHGKSHYSKIVKLRWQRYREMQAQTVSP